MVLMVWRGDLNNMQESHEQECKGEDRGYTGQHTGPTQVADLPVKSQE